MQASEEGSIVKYNQTAPRGRSPAEALLEADVERLLKISAATEIAVFQRFWEFTADRDASGCFAPQLLPDAQFSREARRSENIESCNTPASEELWTRNPFPYSMYPCFLNLFIK
jgi:hypothetical protein